MFEFLKDHAPESQKARFKDLYERFNFQTFPQSNYMIDTKEMPKRRRRLNQQKARKSDFNDFKFTNSLNSLN